MHIDLYKPVIYIFMALLACFFAVVFMNRGRFIVFFINIMYSACCVAAYTISSFLTGLFLAEILKTHYQEQENLIHNLKRKVL